MSTYIFPKSQRLKSRKKLQEVFSRGNTVRIKDIRLIYLIEENGEGDLKCGVGVSAKNFKRAVDRNRIKRLLREAYRLQQHPLKNYIQSRSLNASLFFLFTGKDIPPYQAVFQNVGVALQKLLNSFDAADTAST